MPTGSAVRLLTQGEPQTTVFPKWWKMRIGQGRRVIVCLSAIIVLLIWSGEETPYAAVISESFGVAEWRGAAYLASPGGTFSHCSVYMNYSNNTTLYFSLDARRSMALAISNANWSLKNSDVKKIAVSIDHSIRLDLSGQLEEAEKMLIVNFGISQDVETALARGKRLVVSAARDDYTFDLRSPSLALNRLSKCVALHKQMDHSNNPLTNFSKGSSNTQRPARERLSLRNVIEILDRSGMSYRFLLQAADKQPVEQQLSNLFDYTWETDDNVLGALVQFQISNDISPEAVSNAFIASLNRDCQGDFVLGSRPADHRLHGILRRALSSCSQDNNITRMFYTIINGQTTVTLILSYSDDAQSATTADEKILRAVETILQPLRIRH